MIYRDIYVSCGEGWLRLIDPLIDICKRKGLKIIQVKEKYGGLRFYVDPYDSEVEDMIDIAEGDSLFICEICGAKGMLRTDRHWVKTLCDGCAKGE